MGKNQSRLLCCKKHSNRQDAYPLKNDDSIVRDKKETSSAKGSPNKDKRNVVVPANKNQLQRKLSINSFSKITQKRDEERKQKQQDDREKKRSDRLMRRKSSIQIMKEAKRRKSDVSVVTEDNGAAQTNIDLSQTIVGATSTPKIRRMPTRAKSQLDAKPKSGMDLTNGQGPQFEQPEPDLTIMRKRRSTLRENMMRGTSFSKIQKGLRDYIKKSQDLTKDQLKQSTTSIHKKERQPKSRKSDNLLLSKQSNFDEWNTSSPRKNPNKLELAKQPVQSISGMNMADFIMQMNDGMNKSQHISNPMNQIEAWDMPKKKTLKEKRKEKKKQRKEQMEDQKQEHNNESFGDEGPNDLSKSVQQKNNSIYSILRNGLETDRIIVGQNVNAPKARRPSMDEFDKSIENLITND